MKVLRYLLFPLAILYDLITTIRNYLYDTGVFKSTSFELPVIAVGNLTTGGTGKTPQIEYLIRLLKEDYKVAVLSRGYKRKTKGFLIAKENHSADEVGDEPLQFFSKFKGAITVAVDADRTHGIRSLITKVNPDIVLLDDAYQHRKVKAGFYIVLTKYNDLYKDDFLLPTGNLRESNRGSNRANLIVVTKCPESLSLEEKDKIKAKLNIKKYQKIFFSAIDYDENLKGEKIINIETLENKEIVLVTGIANPTPLLNYLREKEIDVKHLNFPDHHNFTASDILKIKKSYEEIESKEKLILTTEKDYMRLEGKIKDLYYISIKNHFFEEEQAFNRCIKRFITI